MADGRRFDPLAEWLCCDPSTDALDLRGLVPRKFLIGANNAANTNVDLARGMLVCAFLNVLTSAHDRAYVPSGEGDVCRTCVLLLDS